MWIFEQSPQESERNMNADAGRPLDEIHKSTHRNLCDPTKKAEGTRKGEKRACDGAGGVLSLLQKAYPANNDPMFAKIRILQGKSPVYCGIRRTPRRKSLEALIFPNRRSREHNNFSNSFFFSTFKKELHKRFREMRLKS